MPKRKEIAIARFNELENLAVERCLNELDFSVNVWLLPDEIKEYEKLKKEIEK